MTGMTDIVMQTQRLPILASRAEGEIPSPLSEQAGMRAIMRPSDLRDERILGELLDLGMGRVR
jgi:hypothetical protein